VKRSFNKAVNKPHSTKNKSPVLVLVLPVA
jgi:hypothetical protein